MLGQLKQLDAAIPVKRHAKREIYHLFSDSYQALDETFEDHQCSWTSGVIHIMTVSTFIEISILTDALTSEREKYSSWLTQKPFGQVD